MPSNGKVVTGLLAAAVLIIGVGALELAARTHAHTHILRLLMPNLFFLMT
jgi:hypothetical protein